LEEGEGGDEGQSAILSVVKKMKGRRGR